MEIIEIQTNKSITIKLSDKECSWLWSELRNNFRENESLFAGNGVIRGKFLILLDPIYNYRLQQQIDEKIMEYIKNINL